MTAYAYIIGCVLLSRGQTEENSACVPLGGGIAFDGLIVAFEYEFIAFLKPAALVHAIRLADMIGTSVMLEVCD
jgi:hypothetical protein